VVADRSGGGLRGNPADQNASRTDPSNSPESTTVRKENRIPFDIVKLHTIVFRVTRAAPACTTVSRRNPFYDEEGDARVRVVGVERDLDALPERSALALAPVETIMPAKYRRDDEVSPLKTSQLRPACSTGGAVVPTPRG
jgi:hypothetical protein